MEKYGSIYGELVCVTLCITINPLNKDTICGTQIRIKFEIHVVNEVALDSARRLIRPRAASELCRVISAEETTAAALAVHPGVRYLAAAIASGAKLSVLQSEHVHVHAHGHRREHMSMNKPTSGRVQ